MTRSPPSVSVVIPARDEVTCIGPLVEEIGQVLEGSTFEVIVVDDGSTDGTRQALAALAARHRWIVALHNDRPAGQSSAVRRGVRVARAALVVTLDGDGQNPPDQIPALLAPFAAADAGTLGLVQGERIGRRDTRARRWASQAANAIRRSLLRDGVRDSGCGLRAFRRETYLELPWFDHVHRFMPAMVLREGWDVATMPVSHRGRRGGRSKYSNLSRALVGVPDVLGVAWLIRRAGKTPRGRLRAAPPPAQLPATGWVTRPADRTPTA